MKARDLIELPRGDGRSICRHMGYRCGKPVSAHGGVYASLNG
ncbi:hypothetical protein [Nitratireductor pacificus]|nr:hypothetical protein [Nitratireductor pacificus]